MTTQTITPTVESSTPEAGDAAARMLWEVLGALDDDPKHADLVGRVREVLRRAEPAPGCALIAQERERQISEEGWTPDHDDSHVRGELALAGACYAWPLPTPLFVKKAWPWDKKWWKPWPDNTTPTKEDIHAGRIRRLVKAGALIAAEIDRLQRLAAASEVKESMNISDITGQGGLMIPCSRCKGTGQVPDTPKTAALMKDCRERRRISLREVARRMKISAAFVSRLEHGVDPWTLKRVEQFLEAVNQ